MYDFPALLVPCTGKASWCLIGQCIYPADGACEEGKGFCIKEYENSIERIDLLNNLVLDDMIIISRYKALNEAKAYLLKKGDRVCIQEVSSAGVFIEKNEGDMVLEGEKIGSTLSSKGVVRTVRSLCKGIIVLIVNITWESPEKYIIVVVKENELRPIRIGKDKGECVKECTT
ncbi:DUF2118 domain-containing protein [Thermogladius sp. 4427co]|uniref:DUF2118 domain-containing protein n=1 Tax=Thermogladius sp. 4427co TaxID=3450718 RepID=UPI003F799AA6